MNKRFYLKTEYARWWEGFYDQQWDQARDAVRSAAQIVIIGYSFPVADLRATTMILCESNPQAEITVACGGATTRIERVLREHAFRRIHTVPAFESWVAVCGGQ